MEGQNNKSMQEYEAKAEELISLTLGVCEQRLSVGESQGEVLSSAAMCVRDSVKTFLAATRLPHANSASKE